MTRPITPKNAFAGIVPRGLAYLIDCGCAFFLFAITQLLIFWPARSWFGITNEWFRSGINTELYTITTISIPVWLYFSLLESSRWKATLGKRLLGLQVHDQNLLSRVGVRRSLLRTVVKLLPWETAHLVNNLPEPIWYLEQPSFRIGFALSGILMGIYIAVICFNTRRQGIHDLLAGTVVQKKQW